MNFLPLGKERRMCLSPKIRFLMKVNFAFLALMTLSLQLAATTTNGQDISQIEVSITLKDGTFPDLVMAIQNQTGLSFGFPPNYQKEVPAINLDGRKRTVKDILDQVLDGTRLTYKQRKTVVAIFYKDQLRSDIAPGSEDALRVSGKITDAKDQQPIPGASVLVKGTTIGTNTDANGQYAIEVDSDAAILVFSSIGYATVETTVGGRTTIDISLNEDVNSLDEVVVYSTGYDNVSAERTTGSFSQLDRQLVDRNVGPDVISRLNGLTPGLMIDQRAGGKPVLNVRGLTTILGNDQPLIVVDNFPYNGELSTINPNDIEDITVLKDAAAASIWGVRAGNGVIVIRTKRGGNRPLQISFNSNVTIADKPDLFYKPVISSNDFVDVEHKLFDIGFYDASISSPSKPLLSPAVEILLQQRNGTLTEEQANQQLDQLRTRDVRKDLEKHFYQKEVRQQYALNFSGGSESNSYYVSLGYDKNRSSLIGNQDSRVSIIFQNTYRLTKSLSVNGRIAYTERATDNNSNLLDFAGETYRYTRITPGENMPYRLRNEFIENAPSQGFLDWSYNPIKDMSKRNATTTGKNTVAAVGLDYSIIEGLDVEAKYQYESENTGIQAIYDEDSYFARSLINSFSSFNGTEVTGRNIPLGGILTTTNAGLTAHNGRFQLNYSKTFSKHLITSFIGYEIRQVETDAKSNRFYGYNEGTGSVGQVNYTSSYVTYPNFSFSTIPSFNNITGTTDRYRSYFGNFAYTYNEKYTVSGSARVDQSNLFGVNTNQKSAPLWSIGAKWNLNKESFLDNEWLSILNLRATYGYNGNIPQNVTAYTTANLIQTALTNRPAATIVSPPNPDLTWEKSKTVNLAVDLGMFDNRIYAKIEHYWKKGTNLIGQGPIDPTQGISTFKGNIAGMKGHGWDIQIKSLNIDKTFKWKTDFIFNNVSDEITDYSLPTGTVTNYIGDPSISRNTQYYQPIKGRPLFGIYSLRSAGLDPTNGDPRGYVNGEPSSDYSTIFSTYAFDSLQYHGRALPSVFGFLRNTFEYRGLAISFNIKYSFGNYFKRESILYSSISAGQPSGDYSKRWQQPGDEKNTTVPSEIYPASSLRDSFYSGSSDLIDKADNIRIQDVRLSYSLSNLKFAKSRSINLEVYSYITNLGIIWKATNSWVDPDFPQMPAPKTIAFGARLTF